MGINRFLAVPILAAMAMSAQAATVTYILGDHEDGALYDGSTSGPNGPYGLRLDSFTPPAGPGPTFSVGDNLGGNGGVVELTWDDANLAAGATISGTLYQNDNGSSWAVSYSLTGLTDDGNGGWWATAGTGSATNGIDTVILTGELKDGMAFVFADDGYRLPASDGFVGRGWLLGGDGSDDWLVTATIVPIPAAVWLFGSALGMLGWLRRR